jgi:hypothetical protein
MYVSISPVGNVSDGEVIGTVHFRWEHKPSKWLEIGIAIYTLNIGTAVTEQEHCVFGKIA